MGLDTFALVLTSPLRRAAETCALAGFDGAEWIQTSMEWDYGAYEGLTTRRDPGAAPGLVLWHDGVPEGESLADVGRRADRVVARARAVEGDTLCVAHGHLLRVLAARWLGPAAGGRPPLHARRRGGLGTGLGPRVAGGGDVGPPARVL